MNFLVDSNRENVLMNINGISNECVWLPVCVSAGDVKLTLIVSVSTISVVVSSSSLSNGYSDDDPVTPMYSEESSCSSLLVGSKVVSLILSVEVVSSPTVISFVMLSDCVVSVNNGVDEIILVSNVVSTVDCVEVLTLPGVTLGTRIHESPENVVLATFITHNMMLEMIVMLFSLSCPGT